MNPDIHIMNQESEFSQSQRPRFEVGVAANIPMNMGDAAGCKDWDDDKEKNRFLIPNVDKTIAAITTPPGEGGMGVVKITGKDALKIAKKVLSKDIDKLPSHTACFSRILDGDEIIDEGIILVLHGPKTYSGYDTVEIQGHGGLATKRVLDSVLKAGAQMAGPGEFTLQAFLNKKIDLAQAEAIQQMIGAKNQLSLQASKQQLTGQLSKHVTNLQNQLLDIAAILEAWVDFPEEGLEFASKEEVIHSLEKTLNDMHKLSNTFDEGKKIHEGLTLCLAGSPNAGKSSLMNRLLGFERAIVTHVPGTTRDILEAELTLGGLHFQLIDTAGIRETDQLIEKEGIRRTHVAMKDSDLIFLLIDVSKPLSSDEQNLLNQAPREKTLIIWNKTDLPHEIPSNDSPTQVALSAKTGEGIEKLKETLNEMIWKNGPPAKDEVILTNARHKKAIDNAAIALQTVINGLKTDISAEFISSDMRHALKELGTIIGMDVTEEILSSIFSKFCVGK